MDAPARSVGESKQRAEQSLVERNIVLPAQRFIHTETIGAAVLLLAAAIALAWANSPWSDSYARLWEDTHLSFDLGFLAIDESLRHWVNDGLMTIFFFVVGLEVKRELADGELSTLRRAALPLIAALGGMIVPAAIYFAFNYGGDGADGWGVPMATDIAFALGVLALAGKDLPFQARIFLLALAAVDDIGAILVIAIFYSSDISFKALFIAAALLGGVYGLRKVGLRDLQFYLFAAVAVWLAVFESGIHATIAGVALGLLTPSKPFFDLNTFTDALDKIVPRVHKAKDEDRTEAAEFNIGRLEALIVDSEAPLDRRIRRTHAWSSFLILPLFALANAGVEITAEAAAEAVKSMVSIGVFVGLVAGKLAGIVGFSFVAVKTGVAELPENLDWKQLTGLAAVAGIGFTVSLFITELAFTQGQQAGQAKIGILAASLAAGVLGLALLKWAARQRSRGHDAASN